MISRHPPLPALTIHQPWAWLLSVGEKPVENRGWPAPPQLIGKHLAIHAGKTVDEEAYRKVLAGPRPAIWVRDPIPPPEELPVGALVAVAQVAGVILCGESRDGFQPTVKSILGGVSRERAEDLCTNRYAFGPWLWVLENVVKLPVPIPCRGFQKIWTVPEHEADLVRDGWRTATAAAARSTTP